MRIPFLRRKSEHRASYTDAAISAILASVSAQGTLDPIRTSAAQTAAGLLGRSLAIASVDPTLFRSALNPRVLYDIGRALVTVGEDVYLVLVSGGGVVSMQRASDWDVRDGGTGGWRYRLTLPGPTDTHTVDVSADQVFHPRINVSRSEPHRGQSMISLSGHTALTLAAVERTLQHEMSAASGWVLPAPTESISPTDLTELKSDLRSLAGRTSLVPSMATGWGDGRSGAPSDWQPKRFGGSPPDVLVQLRDSAHNAVLSACGVPVALFTPNQATGVREAFRQFLHSTLQPIAELILTEAMEKLSDQISFDFSRLMAADVQGKARSAKALVDAGFSLEQAAAMAGFIQGEGMAV